MSAACPWASVDVKRFHLPEGSRSARERAMARGIATSESPLTCRMKRPCGFISAEFDMSGLEIGGGEPLLQVVEELVGRDEALAADGEERRIRLPVPFSETTEI